MGTEEKSQDATKDLLEPSKEAETAEAPEKETEKENKQVETSEAGAENKEAAGAEDEPPTLEQVRENIRKHEDDLKEEREEIAFYEKRLEKVPQNIVKDLGLDEIVANGKSIYEMTPEEFEGVIDQTYQVHEKEKAAALVAEARRNRKEYFKEAAKYAPAAQKFQTEAEAFRAKEWNLAEKELRALYPGIEKYATDIKDQAVKELNADKVLVERVNQGVVAKFRYLVNLVKSAGIEDKLTKAELKTEQGNREKASAGKGKGSSASESRETAYTPERIKKMSLKEYREHKSKIYAATSTGAKNKE